MNRPELYHKTIKTLNDAWRSGGLERGDCEACAVGNILNSSKWGCLFMTGTGEDGEFRQMDHRIANPDYLIQEAERIIADSGYTIEELAKVEFAFESAPSSNSKRQSQYNGLCAAFDVLAEIHQVDISLSELSKLALDSIHAELAH